MQAHAGVFKRKRTVSFRLCFNACFGQPVDVAGREAVDQSSVLARVSGHREELRKKENVWVGWLESVCRIIAMDEVGSLPSGECATLKMRRTPRPID